MRGYAKLLKVTIMTKQEWQKLYGITDDEMSLLELLVKETGGQIVAIKSTPLRQDGARVPFAERAT